MSRTTGIVLATGALTLGNQALVAGEPVDWRIPIATGLAAGAFALFERAAPDVAVGLAWLMFIAALFVRPKPTVAAPIENALKIWDRGGL